MASRATARSRAISAPVRGSGPGAPAPGTVAGGGSGAAARQRASVEPATQLEAWPWITTGFTTSVAPAGNGSAALVCTVTDTLWPAARSPTMQTTSRPPPAVHTGGCERTKLRPAGSVSVATTPGAGTRPTLLTVIT